nr:GIY-YIG nuclease family protein [Xenorhabdus poinarii]
MNTKISAWFVYLIRTQSGLLYTGITTDVTRRLIQHSTGKGAKFLRGKGPLTLVYQSPARDKGMALKMEYRVKKLSKQQKERLVINQPICLKTYLTTIDSPETLFTQSVIPAKAVITPVMTINYQVEQGK